MQFILCMLSFTLVGAMGPFIICIRMGYCSPVRQLRLGIAIVMLLELLWAWDGCHVANGDSKTCILLEIGWVALMQAGQ